MGIWECKLGEKRCMWYVMIALLLVDMIYKFCGFFFVASDLAREYADMSDLRTLLTGLQLPRQHLTDCGGVSLADGPVCDVTHSRFLTDGLSFSQIQPFRKRLNPSNSADGALCCL